MVSSGRIAAAPLRMRLIISTAGKSEHRKHDVSAVCGAVSRLQPPAASPHHTRHRGQISRSARLALITDRQTDRVTTLRVCV